MLKSIKNLWMIDNIRLKNVVTNKKVVIWSDLISDFM